MAIVKLVSKRFSSYTTPETKQVVGCGEAVKVGPRERDKLVNTGHFVELDTEPRVRVSGGFVHREGEVREPLRSLPRDWSTMSVCIEFCGGIGDTVVAASVVPALKEKDCFVTLAVSDHVVPLAECFVEIDSVISAKALNTPNVYEKFDVVVDMTNAITVGNREMRAGEFHELMYRFLELGSDIRLGTLSFPEKTIRKVLDRMPRGPRVALHTGATNPLRWWQKDRWGKLARHLQKSGASVIFLGQNDFALSDEGLYDWTHESLLVQAIALSLCDFFVGNDSGFLHIAGNLGVPGVGIFGPTNPDDIAKLYPSIQTVTAHGACDRQPCRTLRNECPNDAECIRNVALDTVVDCLPEGIKNARQTVEDIERETSKKIKRKQVALDRKARVLLVPLHLILGGAEIAMQGLCRELRKYFDLYTACVDRSGLLNVGDVRERFVKDGGVLIKPGREIRELRKLIDENDIDVVLYYGTENPIPDVVRGMEIRPTVIRLVRTSHPNERTDAEATADVNDGVICVNPEMCRVIPNSESFGNGFDPARLKKVGEFELDFSEKLPTLGYIGRLSHPKGIIWLVENLGDLGINLVVKGPRSHSVTPGLLRSIAKNAGVAHRLKLLEPDMHVAEVYDAVDGVILVSENEGFPQMILESSWLGVPAITTPVGALTHYFKDGESIVFAERDIKLIKKAVKVLETRGREIGEAARKVSEQFTADKVAVGYRRAIRYLMGTAFPGAIRAGAIQFERYSGAGDILASTAQVHKIREMFPDAMLEYRTNAVFVPMLSNNPDIDRVFVREEQLPDADLRVPLEYLYCWQNDLHFSEGMGGNVYEYQLDLPDGLVEEVSQKIGRRPAVGIAPYQSGLAEKKLKQWPVENWRELTRRLRSRGFSCYQIGADFEERLLFLEDLRQPDILRNAASVVACDLVVTIEGWAGHVAYHFDHPMAFVLWGRAGDVSLTGYEQNTNIITPWNKCKCYGSADVSTLPSSCPQECMSALSVDMVEAAIMERWESRNA